jgi:4-nitrophenyl phosphatase
METMRSLIDHYDGFIIDLDGVVYLLNEPIPGSPDVVRHLQESNIPFVFLTNNSVATPRMYVERLGRLGMEVEPAQVVTSPQAVRRHLEMRGTVAGSTAFVVGEEGLVRELGSAGLVLVEGEEAEGADFVFVGWDRHFDYQKLKTAVVAVRNGAEYIATNTDATYPTPEGLWPGAGSGWTPTSQRGWTRGLTLCWSLPGCRVPRR